MPDTSGSVPRAPDGMQASELLTLALEHLRPSE
jgi:hypothetical protein